MIPASRVAGLLLALVLMSNVHAVELIKDDRPVPPAAVVTGEPPLIFSDHGDVGLLQTPTARMAPDGGFSIFNNRTHPYRRFGVTAQVMPWLEMGARYVIVDDVDTVAGPGFDYVDKGLDFKIRLLPERPGTPAVAVGVRDFAGTGLFDSEYLVLSKRLGAFDISWGAASGNLGEGEDFKNPLCSVAERFCRRGGRTGGVGNFEIGRFLSGPTAFFGGVQWTTPLPGLSFLAELDGNDYENEFLARRARRGNLLGNLKINARSRFNFGLNYRLLPFLDLKLGVERGDALLFGVVLHENLNTFRMPKLSNDAGMAAFADEPQAPVSLDLPRLQYDLYRHAGYSTDVVHYDSKGFRIEALQLNRRDQDAARIRALRVLNNHLPANYETLSIVEKEAGVPQVKFEIERKDIQAMVAAPEAHTDVAQLLVREPVPANFGLAGEQKLPVGAAYYNVTPTLMQSLGGIDVLYAYDLRANLNLAYQLGGTRFDTMISSTIDNNYDKFFIPPATAALPPVRTSIRRYVRAPLRVDAMQLTHFFRLGSEIMGQVYGGQMEFMFGGIGGELLYRPVGQLWGVGLDINRVRQRAPRDPFEFIDYTVNTGHLTWYQTLDSELGLLAKLSWGHYLGGDRGVTLDVSRRFDSGIVIGALAAKTNVSAKDFGEGSFHKAFYINVPLDLLWVKKSRYREPFNWIPIQRDGGQMVRRLYNLWQITGVREGDL